MTQFTLTFLGPFQVRAGAALVTDFHSDKARALLAYLAVEPREHDRKVLATLLWPEIDDQYARTNLRTTLYRLRQTLTNALPGAGDRLLTVTRQTVHFNPTEGVVDVLRFQALLSRQLTATAPEPTQWEEAIALYQGELLMGFNVADAAPFEEWLLLRRELLHQQALVLFHKLATAYETAGRDEQAYAVVGRLLLLDPYREETYQQTMRLLARMGQPHLALQQVEQLRKVLHEAMGVAPAAETLALARQIANGEFGNGAESAASALREPSPPPVTPAPPRPVTPSPVLDLDGVPDLGPFFGRTNECRQLTQWLLHDRCKVVAILGLGGMGKSTLAAQASARWSRMRRALFEAIFGAHW
ncbi:MAG: BTAD domain-containing putative transcriptional regulator [Caldilineaceae bacterium]